MPKLNKEKAKEAAEAASGFLPMPDGVYHFVLRDVDPTREGPKGPYWSWEYECVEDGTVKVTNPDTGKEQDMKLAGRRQWNNTSMASMWAFEQTFRAFGVPTDTDTDELVGQKVVKLQLSTRTIQDGNRKGELSNQVDRVLPPDPEFAEKFAKRVKDQKEMAEIF